MMTDQTFAPSTMPPAREIDNDFERLLQKSFSPREILDGDSLDKMMRIAEQLARSALSVPKHLRDNVGDCLAIVTQAMLWNMNPFAVAQKTHLVNGTLGYEAQLVNAVLQNSGAVRGLPHYEYRGEGNTLECRVGFVPRGEAAVVFGEWLSKGQVTVQNSPLWKTNPRQQLGYLQIKNWARAFVPGAILGVYTVDELEDTLMGRDVPASEPPPPAGPKRKSDQTTAAAPTASVDKSTGEIISSTPAHVASPPAPAAAPKPAATPAAAPAAGGISGGQVAYLRNKLKAAGIDEATICNRFSVAGIEHLTGESFDTLKVELLEMA